MATPGITLPGEFGIDRTADDMLCLPRLSDCLFHFYPLLMSRYG